MSGDRCDVCGNWSLAVVCPACVIEVADDLVHNLPADVRTPGDAAAGAAACRAALAEARARRQAAS